MKKLLHAPFLLAAAMLLAGSSAHAITFSLFLPSGEGGRVNGQTLTIGPGGEVEELGAYLAIDGLDLNGADAGVAASLSAATLPTGLDFAFSSSLTTDATDLTLSYQFTNNTGSALGGITFLSYMDAEIDERVNSFFNEFATVLGTPAVGQGYEIDEPGFLFGDITDNLALGVLDNTNAVPSSAPEDVSMALSFSISELGAGETLDVAILISEDGSSIGPLALQQADASSTGTEITYSGTATVSGGPTPVIPEPGAAAVFGLGALLVLRVARRER